MTARKLLTAAKAKDAMIVTAESCTGGMISAAITDIPGSSAIFDRGFVTYSNTAKMQMLDVQADTLARFGAVSEQVAAEMAQGALTHSNATISVAVTGIAGPGGSDHKPEGLICFAWASHHSLQVETVSFGALGRAQIRNATCKHALAGLIDLITK